MKATADPFTSVAFDRTPPYSEEAERAVLSSILREPAVMDEVRPLLNGGSFFLADNRIIYESLCAMHSAGKPADVIVLRDHLRSRGLFEEVGGSPMLASLFGDGALYAGHVEHYVGIVVEKAKKRELLSLSLQIARECCEDTGLAANALAERMAGTAERITETGTADTIRSLEDVVAAVVKDKAARKTNRIRTGLADLDDLCGGIPIGLMTLVAGKAGMGKSQTCKQFAKNIASGIADPYKSGKFIQDPMSVGIITVEENAEKIATNYLAAASGIANSKIVYNTLSEEEVGEIDRAKASLRLPIYIEDSRDRLSEIRRTAKRMVRHHGCRVIVVDHLHLIDGETDATREQEISQISRGLKMLWKELGVAGVVAAQLNRGGDREAVPELDNLRGSGSLEQDGDLIIQLHRQDYFEWKKHGNNFTPDHCLKMFVNKNKDGPVGSRDTYFDGDSQTVTDWNDGVGPKRAPRATYDPWKD